MARKPLKSKIRDIVYIILSFILSLLLLLLSVSITMQATLFNQSNWISNMHAAHYFSDKKDELTNALTNLGHATGLNQEFFTDMVDEVMLVNDTETYVTEYFVGAGSVFPDTAFKQAFNSALDSYIKENNLEVDSKNRETMIKEAAKIYKQKMAIPALGTVSTYFLYVKKMLPIAVSALAAFAAGIILVFIFTCKWKHRAVKYICFATSATFLAMVIPSAYALISKGITYINLESRALYNLFVLAANNICVALLVISIIFLAISVGLYFTFRSLYHKASGH